MAVISEQFNVGDEICGLVVSVRHSEDILSIWNRTSTDTETNLKIRDTIKRVLGLPLETVMEYKSHNDAIQDNSSFRNTAVYK
jgi:translation initiation factor 4E